MSIPSINSDSHNSFLLPWDYTANVVTEQDLPVEIQQKNTTSVPSTQNLNYETTYESRAGSTEEQRDVPQEIGTTQCWRYLDNRE